MAVKVVKEYEATSDFVFVTLDKNVDFPTEGKPTREIRASPLLLTSKPEPAPPPAPGPGSRSCALNRASFLVTVSIQHQCRVLLHEGITKTALTLLIDQDDILRCVNPVHFIVVVIDVPVALFSVRILALILSYERGIENECIPVEFQPHHVELPRFLIHLSFVMLSSECEPEL